MREAKKWQRRRFCSARAAEAFAEAMYDIGYTTYSGSYPIIRDNSKFHGFTWGTSQDEEKRKIIIFTPSREVYASWTWAKELSE